MKWPLGYEPIPGDKTLFRQEDGQVVHLLEKEQAELGLPSRADEPKKKAKSGIMPRSTDETQSLRRGYWANCQRCGKRVVHANSTRLPFHMHRFSKKCTTIAESRRVKPVLSHPEDSDECDQCDGSGWYKIDGVNQTCICQDDNGTRKELT